MADQTIEIEIRINRRAIRAEEGDEISFKATGDAVRIRFPDSPFQEEDGVEQIIMLGGDGSAHADAGKFKIKKQSDPQSGRPHYFTIEAAFAPGAAPSAPCIIVGGNGA